MTRGLRSRRPSIAGSLVIDIAVIGIVVLAAACGTDETASASADPVDPTTTTVAPEAPPATTLPNPTTIPTTDIPTTPSPTTSEPIRPMRVLLTGDSLMVDAADAISAALATADRPLVVQFEGQASRPRDVARTEHWRQRADAFDPDLVVEFMGFWEFAAAGLDDPPPGTEGFAAAYTANTLTPWFDHLASLDADTIVVTPAPSANTDVSETIVEIVAVAEAAIAPRDDVWFAPTTPVLAPDGYVDALPDPITGALERIRRTDGIHLCPDGAERVADLVLAIVTREYGISFDDSWRPGEWRSALPVDLAVECPPI